MNILKKFSPRSFDWGLVSAAFFLVAIGLSAVYSVDLSRGTELINFKKQVIATLIGLTLLIGASVTSYTWFRAYAKAFFGGSIGLLVGVLVFGTTIRGTRGWFVFPGFSFQPVEIAKIALIFILAYIIYHFGRRFDRPLFFFGTAAVTLCVAGLTMLQPDLGSSVILLLLWFGIMFLVGVRWRYLGTLILLGIISSAFAWMFLLQPYQKDRVLTFMHPERQPLGAGYNTTQAIIAVGAGKIFGRGLGFGSQSQLRFLPEAQTDFIFSVIGEELGLAGASLVLALYAFMLWRLLTIARSAKDDFVSVAAHGIALLFFLQFVINVGANLGLLPITGVTLPFVSYGGSSLIVNLFLIGVAEAMVVKKY